MCFDLLFRISQKRTYDSVNRLIGHLNFQRDFFCKKKCRHSPFFARKRIENISNSVRLSRFRIDCQIKYSAGFFEESLFDIRIKLKFRYEGRMYDFVRIIIKHRERLCAAEHQLKLPACMAKLVVCILVFHCAPKVARENVLRHQLSPISGFWELARQAPAIFHFGEDILYRHKDSLDWYHLEREAPRIFYLYQYIY